MKAQDIWNLICEFACSQGFYGRLKRDIIESGRMKEILKEWEDMNFSSELDFILYLES